MLASHHEMEAGAAIRPTAGTVPAGRFGPYRAVELLAQGGMSCVYRAERIDGQFQQTVSLKVMAAWLAEPEFLRRFEMERQFLATLNHPHITQLLDGGVSSAGDPYLVTEFVQGEHIDRHCDLRELNIEARLRLFLQVCDAVDYAHRNLILHRDLKPGNILVNEQGNVKLLDFGTASILANPADVTITRMRMLTPRYASPEQLRGGRVGMATDIYSLGIILYELLTGAWPFGNPDSVISGFGRALDDAAPKPPATVVSREAAQKRSSSAAAMARTLRRDLSTILLKALENDSSRRYPSVQSLADDIRNYLDGRPVLARPQTFPYRTGKFLRKHWLPASAIGLVALTLAGSTVLALRQARTTRAVAEQAVAQARKAEKISFFLNDVLSSAGRLSFEPEKFTVAQMLDAAGVQLESAWKDEPLVEATLRNSLANSYAAMQRFDQARAHLEKALATARAVHDLPTEAITLGALGHLASQTGEYEKSVDYYRQALARFEIAGAAAPDVEVFRSKRDSAYALANFLRRDLPTARKRIDEAIHLAQIHPEAIPRFDVVQALSIQASIQVQQRNEREAERTLRNALQVARQDATGRDAGVPLSQLMVLKARQEQFAEARDFAAEWYRLTLPILGPENRFTAVAEIAWARYRAETGEAREAVSQTEHAMRTLRKVFDKTSGNLWFPLNCAAVVMNHAGRYQEAERYARELLVLHDAEHLPDTDIRRSEALSQLGEALLAQGQRTAGIALLERSLKGYEQAAPNFPRRAQQIRAALQAPPPSRH